MKPLETTGLRHGRKPESVRMPIRERFWSKVEKIAGGCWLWRAARTSNGYGEFSIRHRGYLAHRLAYQMTKGPIAQGLEIDHLCRVRQCVNPDHLEAVTPEENNRRAPKPGAPKGPRPERWEAACGKGHAMVGANVVVNKQGRRKCRECKRETLRRCRARKREMANAQS